MRKRTVQSVLARRHMFKNGGMVPPQAQPAGILASSPSLVDAVSNDALSDMGGGTLSMAQGGAAVNMQPSYVFNQGGIAKFANGGLNSATGPNAKVSFSLNPSNYGKIIPTGGPSQLAIDLDSRNRKFLYDALLKREMDAQDRNKLLDPVEDLYNYMFSSASEAPQRAAEREAENRESTGRQEDSKNFGLDTYLSQVNAPEDVIKYYQDRRNVIEDANKLGIDKVDFSSADKAEREDTLGGMSRVGDGQEPNTLIGPGTPDFDGGFKAPFVSSLFAPVAGVDAGVSDGDLSLEDGIEAPDPSPQSVVPGTVRDKKETDIEDILPPKIKPSAPEKPVDSSAGVDQSGFTEDSIPADVDVEKILETTKVNDKGEEVPKTKQDYIKEFKENMPNYEGMSEEEKGFTIMEAGLRVMAGKSPDAIQNIGDGLKGVTAEFVKDKKARRAFDQQIDLSAAKYSLTKLSEIDKLKQSDDRALTKFYDLSKATKDNPYGETVFVSRSEILDAGGKLPPKYKSESFVLAQMKDASDLKAKLAKLTSDAVKDKTIGYKEAEKINSQLDLATRTFRSSEVGKQLISGVITKVVKNPEDILGGAAVATDLFRQAMNTVGVKIDKKYSSKEEAANDIRRAFQLLIPITLGSSQSANSISNRDVQFLADAYVNSGFLKADGSLSLSLATGSAPVLVKQLQGAMQKFTDSQNEALTIYDRNVSLINDSYKKGRFGVKYFSPALEKIRPSAERFRATSTGKGTVISRPYSYQLDPATGLMRPKGNKGTAFSNKFFSPSNANFNKIYGR